MSTAINTPVKIVFLDRATIGAGIAIPRPSSPHEWLEYATTSLDQRVERLKGAQVLITNKVPVDKSLLEACSELRYVAVAATGFNIIDLEACAAQGVTVCNVKAYSTAGVAEHVFAFILALRKQIKFYQSSLQAGAWPKAKQFTYFHEPISNIAGTTLGIIGTGAIAQAVAKIANAFDVAVLWHSPSGRDSVNGQSCVSLSEILSRSDVVSIHCPLTELTRDLIDSAALAMMKPSALLINTARGPIVDSAALAIALKDGVIAGAGIDVLPIEPPPHDEPLLQCLNLPNLLMTAHTAWASEQSQTQLMSRLVAQLNDFLAGRHVDDLAVKYK